MRYELLLMDKHSGLAAAACDLLATLGNKLDLKTFSKHVWPQVKERATKQLEFLAPEWFHFDLTICERHADVLKDELSFLSADGNIIFTEDDYEKVVDILKRASGWEESELITKLLFLSRKAGNFSTVYGNIVEKWLYHGDRHKVRCKNFTIM